jgi:hypothetical protein
MINKIKNYIKRKLAEFIYPELHRLYDIAIENAEKRIR